MAQFDAYENPSATSRKAIPLLLDLQCDHLADLATRVVAPLYRAEAYGPAARHLSPVFSVNGMRLVMSTGELAAVPKKILRRKIASLAGERAEIVGALDFLFLGI